MNYIIVGIAGIAGALLRYYLGVWTHNWWEFSFPLATLITNLLGSICLGWLFTHAANSKVLHPWVRLGIGTGFIGSFTTFSTFSVETIMLMQQGLWPVALIYVLASLCGGMWMAWLGGRIASLQIDQKRVKKE